MNELARYNDLALRAQDNARRNAARATSLVPRREPSAVQTAPVSAAEAGAAGTQARSYETIVAIRVEVLEQKQREASAARQESYARTQTIDAVGETVDYTPRLRALPRGEDPQPSAASEYPPLSAAALAGHGAAAYAMQRSIAEAGQAPPPQRLLDVRA